MSSELRKRSKEVKDNSFQEETNKKIQEKNPLSPMDIAQEKYRKFFTRSIWGSLMILVFAIILYAGHIWVSLFVVLIQIVVFKEMSSIRFTEAKEKKLWGFRSLHWFFLFGTLFYVYGNSLLDVFTRIIYEQAGIDISFLTKFHLLISFIFYVIGFVAFILTLRKGTLKYQFSQLTWTLMILLIVIGQSNYIIQNTFKGLFWFLFPCSLIICNDIMAYMCGLLAGRKFIDKPLTKLSPNKTWEGFIGALFCTLIWSIFFSKFLAQYDWFICPKDISHDLSLSITHCVPDSIFLPRQYNFPSLIKNLFHFCGYNFSSIILLPIQLHGLIFALFASLIAPFGGFFASGIKRAYQKKDFDNLFPGHGGVTDRMDCEFIMGLFTYVYHTVFINTSVLDVVQIISALSQLPNSDQTLVLEYLNQTLRKM
jgi:phosphatidate cytidylyltransferase